VSDNASSAPQAGVNLDETQHSRVASFKIPRYVMFVDEFPMTSSGKVQKVKLRERARQEWPEPSGSVGA
jgi:acyl-CoA synthetase (AMP-forming)/AMP-acid ligase II